MRTKMTTSYSRCTSTIFYRRTGVLLLSFSIVCNVYSVPVLPSQNLCPQENIPSNQIQSWPMNIIPYKMSSNLTDNARRQLLRAMDVWERRICIAFIPSHQQEQEMEHFVYFVPGERCCSDRGRMGRKRQNVYIHDTCISDRTLENVIGVLIGYTQPSTNGGLQGETEAAIPGSHNPNLTSGEQDTYSLTQSECRNTCFKHITGKLHGRFKHGRIYSPNYPMEYPSNVEYVWKINVPENSVLQLNIQQFDTECSHDYLEMHHLTAEGHIKSLPRLCGYQTNHDAIMSHLTVDTVILRFHTDTTYNKEGFNISYTFIENKHQCDVHNGGCSYRCETDSSSGIGRCVCEPGYRVSRNGACRDINECKRYYHGCEQNCDNLPGSYQCFCNQGYALSLDERSCKSCVAEFNETEGVIMSTGYPGFYQNHQNCRYTIFIHPEHILRMSLFVDIQRSYKCKTEFLKLEHGYFMYNRRLCDYVNNITYYIKDSNVTSTSLRFRTRDLNSIKEHPSSGFEVQFKQVLRSSVSEEEINQVRTRGGTRAYQERPWLNLTQ